MSTEILTSRILQSIDEIDPSFILISKNYLNDIQLEIIDEFFEPVEPRVILQFDFTKFKEKVLREAESYYFQIKKKIAQTNNMVDKIYLLLKAGRYRAGTTVQTKFNESKDLFKSIIEKSVINNKEILFILPSFPFKCPNPSKVRRRLPDMAEILCLARLYEICTVISFFYPPGARFIIIADGQVYKDMFGISSYEATQYRDISKKFIDELGFLDKIEMTDMELLIENYAGIYDKYEKILRPIFSKWWKKNFYNERVQSLIDACSANIVSNSHICQDVTRLCTSRILKEVELDTIGIVINSIRKKIYNRSETCAFEYAFFLFLLKEIELLKLNYPGGIRSTVHPKPQQWGIHLVNAKSRIFPWHGVAFHGMNGWKMAYESVLINERQRPVYIQGEDYPFFYESLDNPAF